VEITGCNDDDDDGHNDCEDQEDDDDGQNRKGVSEDDDNASMWLCLKTPHTWSMVGVLKVGFDNPTDFGLEAREDNFRIRAI
jgi:hypothetical protein